jgi:hypothetical protein
MIYRAASGVSLEKLQLLDMEWIDKIGTDEFGRSKWRKLSPEEKYEAVYQTMSEESVYDEVLAGTNFPRFLNALKEAVGGPTVQLKLIKKQLSIALKAVQTFDATTVSTISKIKCISERLGIATDMTFNDHFWTTYKNYIADATEVYKTNTDHKVFRVAMSQLIAYDAELSQTDSHETEHQKVVDAIISLLRLQLRELLKYAESWQQRYLEQTHVTECLVYFDEQWKYAYDGSTLSARTNQPPQNDAHHWNRIGMESWKNKFTGEQINTKYNPVTKQVDWFELSMRDFEIAFASILLASSCKPFWLHFGREKIRMESLLRQFDGLRTLFIDPNSESEFFIMFSSIAGTYNDDGNFVPTEFERYKVFVHFDMPDEISDPEHWGHLAWMFCEFMEKSSQSKSNV